MRAPTYLFRETIAAAAPLAENRFVTTLGTVPAAGARVIGVGVQKAVAGEMIAATVIGTELVVAGGPVAKGAAVETDAEGRAVTMASGTKAGIALSAAAAAGEMIEVLLTP